LTSLIFHFAKGFLAKNFLMTAQRDFGFGQQPVKGRGQISSWLIAPRSRRKELPKIVKRMKLINRGKFPKDGHKKRCEMTIFEKILKKNISV